MINTSTDNKQIEIIISTLEKFTSASTPFRPSVIKSKDYQSKRCFSIFSDNIVISFDIDLESEIYYTIQDVQNIIILLIANNVLIRGAIICGE